MKFKVTGILMMAVLLASVLAIGCAPKAEEYPSKDIRFIASWGAGGGADAIARTICPLAEPELGVSVYVENIEGAAGGVGCYEAMQAAPDGYTITSIVYRNLVTLPRSGMVEGYDLDKLDFFGMITQEGDGVIVKMDAPYQTLDDIIQAAKAEPGKLAIGNDGVGGVTHIGALFIEEAYGVEFKHISYPAGAAPLKEALLSGEVQIVVSSLGDFSPLLDAGEARGIAEMAEERNPKYDVPTFKELGKDITFGSFMVLSTSAGTPADRVKILEAAFHKAWSSPEFQDWCGSIGVTAVWMQDPELTPWLMDLQGRSFAFLDRLVEAGILKE